MTTVTDPAVSARYLERLESHLRAAILDGANEFVCSSGAACRTSAEDKGFGFAAGQLSYVGRGYACETGLVPIRILIVSMQVGDAEAPVTMNRRAEQLLARVPESAGQRNPHMRGVVRALQLLHGLTIEPHDELLADETHVLEACAMANSVLCSALPTGGRSRRGKPTTTMLTNCSRHLEETIWRLEPTIVHTQGVETRTAIERLGHEIEHCNDLVSVVEISGQRIVLCATSHPAAGPPRSWSNIKEGSYFDEEIAPALRLARRVALDRQGTRPNLRTDDKLPDVTDSEIAGGEESPTRRAAIVGRAGQVVLSAVDQGVTTRWESAQRRVANLPNNDIEASIDEIRRAFRTELGVAGAAAGGAAAFPGAVAPGIAAGLAELSWSTVRIADMILTVAVVHGHDDASVEERRAWVLAVLAYGNAASATVSKLASELGKGLGKKATASIPAPTLRALNRALGRTIITKYGTKRGAIALGRLLPLGIGAGIGYGMNVLLVNQVAGHAHKFFQELPAELAGATATIPGTAD